jgi:flavin reductase (DIM6/NTAB) family NADH-FMN oxidoreductase RutF
VREVPYSEAIRRKYPEQIVLAVSVDGAGQADVITLGWAMPTSGEPPMWAISVGHTRYSHELIEKGGEFVLALPSTELAEACRLCGSKSGRDTNKISLARLRPEPARLVRPPLLAGCLANFECRVCGRLVTGDHTIFAGEVLTSHVDDSAGERVYNFGDRFLGVRSEMASG